MVVKKSLEPNFVKISQTLQRYWDIWLSSWQPSAISDFHNFDLLMIILNFVETGQTIAKIKQFINFFFRMAACCYLEFDPPTKST